ncbi:MAG: tRNA-dihydrouridine synthase [Caldiserica bacterium]|nr:tRNA-dihydrouridine synthase [Caldisericota bacterium]MDH7563019.1 tRNA-dihydrouridine synthase [Caldisericota bacterium]
MRGIRESEFPKPLIALAPLSEYNDLAFLRLCREFGAQLVFLGLVSSEGLSRRNQKTLELIRIDHSVRPAFAQIFGSDPGSMGEAARIIEELGFDGVDINFGCPARKVIRVSAGAALLENLPLARKVVKAVRKAVKIPVTVKMRLGPTGKEHLELAKSAEGEGVDALILHPRTLKQGFRGKADWEKIGELKTLVSIPVFASGDVTDGRSFIEVLRITKCDGALIGRAARGNPWVFRECLGVLKGQGTSQVNLNERKEVILKYLEYLQVYYGERGLKFARLHLPFFLKGLPLASELRRNIQLSSFSRVRELIQNYFQKLGSEK